MKKFFILVAFFSLNGHAQKVGINTDTPDSTLTVAGSANISGTVKSSKLQVTSGAGANKILQSDSLGNAVWVNQASITASNLPSIQICDQVWTTINLDVNTYRNGDPIPHVTDPAVWGTLSTGAYCYYNNDSATYAALYGKLYNWFAVNDPRGLAPQGWHIPSDAEWTLLTDCLGSKTMAGGRMKFPGTSFWSAPNTAATNISGFSGLPGGMRGSSGGLFSANGQIGYWWTSSSRNSSEAWDRFLRSDSPQAGKLDGYFKKGGFSVRCVKN
jgi:uncharacterized protein (TIGR02145 family)